MWFAHSALVVADTPERLVLFEPAGAMRQWSHIDFATGEVTPPRPMRRHSTDALILLPAGATHAVSLFWRAGGGPFLCWYVDIQAAFRRVADGVVTWDQSLDIVVGRDLRWTLKDEDHLARLPALGLATQAEVEAIRSEAGRVIARIEARSAPFDEDWPDWRPDPAWPTPELSPDWGRAT